MPKKELKNWEEELKELELKIPDGKLKDCLVYHEATKEFISTLRNQTREEAIREVEEFIDKYEPSYCGVLDGNEKRRGYEIGINEFSKEIKQSLKSLRDK